VNPSCSPCKFRPDSPSPLCVFAPLREAKKLRAAAVLEPVELGGDALLDGRGAEGGGEDVPGVGFDLEVHLREMGDAGQEVRGEFGAGGMERAGLREMEGDVKVDADLGGTEGWECVECGGEIGPACDVAIGEACFDLMEIDGLVEGAQGIKGGGRVDGAEGGGDLDFGDADAFGFVKAQG
jgi:hypothetical protein